MGEKPVTDRLCEERRGSCVALIEEKFKGLRSQIKTGFAVATAVIVLVDFALKFGVP